ncbi:MAG: PEGA domain-containing protein [Alphaproteobacteria bacterium]|nr:PEGA domain-containing protein [Alphaproteobacteria bacterium]
MERVGVEPGAERWLAVLPGEPAELVWVLWSTASEAPGLAEDLRRAGMIRHADVLRVREVGRADGRPFVVVDHVDGLDLATVLELLDASGERVPLGFAASIVLELCRVVHHLELRTDDKGAALDWVLRGLPLDRVWIRVDGRVRVDLRGLVVSPAEAAARGPTPGAFASPELAAGGPVGRPSDVWILGAVLQRLVTGRLTAEGAPPAREAPADTQASLASIAGLLARATATAPEDRYANAQDLGDALRRAALVGSAPRLVRGALASWVCDLGSASLGAARERVAARLEELGSGRAQAVEAKAQAARARLRGARRVGVTAGLLLAALSVGAAFAALSSRALETPAIAQVETGALVVDATLPVRLTVDGRGQGTGAHLEVTGLAPGDHVVGAEADGHVPRTWPVVVARGGTTRLAVSLEREETVQPAVLSVDSRPAGASVRIDGVRVGTTPLRHVLRAGKTAAEVVVDKRGFAAERRRVSGLDPGERRALSFTLGPAGSAGEESP